MKLKCQSGVSQIGANIAELSSSNLFKIFEMLSSKGKYLNKTLHVSRQTQSYE